MTNLDVTEFDVHEFAPKVNKDSKNVLILGSGPSIYNNMSNLKSYCEKYDPLIIGINGCFHGMLSLKENEKIDTDSLLPHVLFSFYKRNEKFAPTGEKSTRPKHKIYKNFIVNRQQAIINRGTALICPVPELKLRKRVNPRYAHATFSWWGYDRVYSMDLNGARLGGEFVLKYFSSTNPDRLAICGILDLPNPRVFERAAKTGIRYTQRRGWFWTKFNKVIPTSIIKTQLDILKRIRRQCKFTDLNSHPFADWDN